MTIVLNTMDRTSIEFLGGNHMIDHSNDGHDSGNYDVDATYHMSRSELKNPEQEIHNSTLRIPNFHRLAGFEPMESGDHTTVIEMPPRQSNFKVLIGKLTPTFEFSLKNVIWKKFIHSEYLKEKQLNPLDVVDGRNDSAFERVKQNFTFCRSKEILTDMSLELDFVGTSDNALHSFTRNFPNGFSSSIRKVLRTKYIHSDWLLNLAGKSLEETLPPPNFHQLPGFRPDIGGGQSELRFIPIKR